MLVNLWKVPACHWQGLGVLSEITHILAALAEGNLKQH